MDTIFWDAAGILLVDFLERGKTINGDYCASILGKPQKAIIQKRQGKLKKGIRHLQDDAPAHKSRIALKKAIECGL